MKKNYEKTQADENDEKCVSDCKTQGFLHVHVHARAMNATMNFDEQFYVPCSPVCFLILLTARVPQLVEARLARFAWMRERKSSAAFVGSTGASAN